MHEDADVSPVSLLHVPLGQSTAAVAPPAQKAPLGHSDPEGEVEEEAQANPASAVHGLQRLLLPSEYVPAAHDKHAARED